jgi:hypothetical protein
MRESISCWISVLCSSVNILPLLTNYKTIDYYYSAIPCKLRAER